MTFSSSSSRRYNRVASLCALATAVLILCSGCTSVRVVNSLGEQHVSNASVGGPYFVVSADGVRNFDAVSFNRMLHTRYPALFAQTPDAVPIMARIGQGATKNSDFLPAFLLGVMPQTLSAGLLGTIWESDWSKLDVAIIVSDSEEPTTSVEVSASRQSHGLLFAPVARLFQWPSKGWHRPRGDLAAEEFEGVVNAIADALAATLAKMTPEDRAVLRRNPVALQRFQKKFPWGFGIQKRGVSEKIIHVYPASPGGAGPVPKIVGRTFNAMTRRGEIRADISGCDYVAAQRRLLNEDIPGFCREALGRDISLLSIQGESLGPDRVLQLSFVVVE